MSRNEASADETEICILVDENDTATGQAPKRDCHHGAGLLHRAFSVLLFNPAGELLIQRRASHKTTFPGAWANACCSHPLFNLGEHHNPVQGVKAAAKRKLRQELGIFDDQLCTDDLVLMTRMLYHADCGARGIEREIDYLIVLQAELELSPNPEEIEEVRWLAAPELHAWLSEHSAQIAPWFREIAQRYLPVWWPQLHALEGLQEGGINDVGTLS